MRRLILYAVRRGTYGRVVVIRDGNGNLVTGEVRRGEMYMPICSSDERVNYLTSTVTDPVVKTPAYKESSVRLEKLGPTGISPMPRGNPRFGNPTPQVGVHVERKWERADYRRPDMPRAPEAPF